MIHPPEATDSTPARIRSSSARRSWLFILPFMAISFINTTLSNLEYNSGPSAHGGCEKCT
jgi:hypothetical protein